MSPLRWNHRFFHGPSREADKYFSRTWSALQKVQIVTTFPWWILILTRYSLHCETDGHKQSASKLSNWLLNCVNLSNFWLGTRTFSKLSESSISIHHSRHQNWRSKISAINNQMSTLLWALSFGAYFIHASAQTIIFRLDDIQDYYLVPEQVAIIDLFLDKGYLFQWEWLVALSLAMTPSLYQRWSMLLIQATRFSTMVAIRWLFSTSFRKLRRGHEF